MGSVADLKLTRHERAFYTTISINNQNADMLLDTGSEKNLFTDSAAARLRLKRTYNGGNDFEGIGGQREGGAVRSREVSLANARGENLKFATVADSASPLDADGVLGMDFLHDYDMDLDFWGSRLGVYKAAHYCATPITAMTGQLCAPMVIGGLTVRNMPIVVANQRHLEGTNMLLGFDFVMRVHLWISRSSNTLIMQYPPMVTPPPG